MNPRQKLWDHLDRVRQGLRLSDEEYFDLLGMTPQAHDRFRARGKTPSVSSLATLVSQLDIDLDSFLSGDIDWSALTRRLTVAPDTLPERYAVGAFSRRRTSADALNFLEHRFGWREKDLALRRFELNPAAFSDPEKLISLRFLGDLLAYLRTRGFGNAEFLEMGYATAVTPASIPIRRKVAGARSVQELYDLQVNHVVTMYDTNFRYRLTKLESERCVIEAKDRNEVREALGVRRLGSADTCVYRGGRIAAMPGHVGLPRSVVTETRCVHRGDSVCRYEVGLEGVSAL